MKKKSNKKHILFYKILSFLLIILTIILNALMIYKETFGYFTLFLFAIISILICFIINKAFSKNKLKKWVKNLLAFISVIIIIFEILFMIYGVNTFKFLKNIYDNGNRTETFYVYVLNTSSYKEIGDLKNKSMSYLKTDDDTNIKKALAKITKKVEFKYDETDTLENLLYNLVNQKIDSILLEKSYVDIIKEEYKEEYKKIKSIFSIDVITKVNTLKSDVNISKEPFVIYISGIDTNGKVASKARSDVNILLAVNPKTGNILMINTPRDYYLTFHTKGVKDKLTHAGVYGVEESLMTLEDFYTTKIHYYVRLNFTSFVKIVDALDGVSVDIEGDFCEQTSSRKSKEKICLSKGIQTINGEQALAYARNRHAFAGGDRSRGKHQMQIIEAIVNKCMSSKILTKYNSILSDLGDSVSTNMTTDEMISFTKKQINKGTNWKFTSLSVDGKGGSEKCLAVGAGKASVIIPNYDTVNRSIDALNNLIKGKENVLEGLEES